MTMAIKNPTIKLYPVYCSKCKRFLIQAPLESTSMCPDCGVWVKTELFKSKPERKDD
jgi:rRNA maturation endonuclease Nob1